MVKGSTSSTPSFNDTPAAIPAMSVSPVWITSKASVSVASAPRSWARGNGGPPGITAAILSGGWGGGNGVTSVPVTPVTTFGADGAGRSMSRSSRCDTTCPLTVRRGFSATASSPDRSPAREVMVEVIRNGIGPGASVSRAWKAMAFRPAGKLSSRAAGSAASPVTSSPIPFPSLGFSTFPRTVTWAPGACQRASTATGPAAPPVSQGSVPAVPSRSETKRGVTRRAAKRKGSVPCPDSVTFSSRARDMVSGPVRDMVSSPVRGGAGSASTEATRSSSA